ARIAQNLQSSTARRIAVLATCQSTRGNFLVSGRGTPIALEVRPDDVFVVPRLRSGQVIDLARAARGRAWRSPCRLSGSNGLNGRLTRRADSWRLRVAVSTASTRV